MKTQTPSPKSPQRPATTSAPQQKLTSSNVYDEKAKRGEPLEAKTPKERSPKQENL